jgi:hypothetical protein
MMPVRKLGYSMLSSNEGIGVSLRHKIKDVFFFSSDFVVDVKDLVQFYSTSKDKNTKV